MPDGWQLAQLNVAKWVVDPEGAVAREFLDQLDEIDARAQAAPGWVWSNEEEDLSDTPWDERWLVNLSVWTDVASLRAFAFGDDKHAAAMRRRLRWFAPLHRPTSVLWWVAAGHRPTLAEAAGRLEQLEQDGPTPVAFTFGTPFPAPA